MEWRDLLADESVQLERAAPADGHSFYCSDRQGSSPGRKGGGLRRNRSTPTTATTTIFIVEIRSVHCALGLTAKSGLFKFVPTWIGIISANHD